MKFNLSKHTATTNVLVDQIGVTMPRITILLPRSPKATTKSFEQVDGEIVKLSNYDIGAFFDYKVVNISGIAGMHDTLDKLKGTKAIRIYGEPTKNTNDLTAQQKKAMTYKGVRRKKENFQDAKTQLLLIDADGWPVPDGFSIDTKENLHATIQEIVLNQMGLKFLDEVHYCCLLSASQWKEHELRAHLYYMIDGEVSLSDLTKWGKAQNIMTKDYKIDYSLFRQVQPDFISKRLCQGFADPLSDSLRLTLHCDSLLPDISKADLLKHSKSVQEDAAAKIMLEDDVDSDDPYATNMLVDDDNKDPIASTWEKTLDLCGKYVEVTGTSNVNDPAYRAAAQLVQNKGNREVKQHLSSYVDRMFIRMWTAIRKHKVRDTVETRQTYTKEKVKGYIQTALAKSFGSAVDDALAPIHRLIDQIRTGAASPTSLLDSVSIADIKNIQKKFPDKFPGIRERVKNELKGKVSTTEYDKALKDSEPPINENAEAEDIIDMFEWFLGKHDKAQYARLRGGQQQSVSSIDAIQGKIKDIVFEKLGSKYARILPELIVNRVDAQSDDEIYGRFTETPIALRSYMELHEGKNILYYNTAEPSNTTLVIDENGIEPIPTQTAPVLWRSTAMVHPAPIEEYQAEVDKFGLLAKDTYIDTYVNGMRRFTTVEGNEHLIEMLAWQVVAAINSGAANLLQIIGSSEGGKSSTALFAKELVDPSSSDLRDDKKMHKKLYKDEALTKVLNESHVSIFDNLTKLAPDDQTTLCTISTGITASSRRLYSNIIENVMLKKPIILTAITEVATAPDLLTRTMTVFVDKDRKDDSTDLYLDWEHRVKAMRTGFLFLLSEVIAKVNQRRKDKRNLNDRNLWATEAKKVLYLKLGMVGAQELDEVIEEKVLQVKRDDNTHTAMNNGYVCGLAAWFLYGPEFQGKKRNQFVEMGTSELYAAYEDFMDDKFGEELVVYGEPRRLATGDRIANTRQFGKIIANNSTPLMEATGWLAKSNKNPTRVRGRSARTTRITKKAKAP